MQPPPRLAAVLAASVCVVSSSRLVGVASQQFAQETNDGSAGDASNSSTPGALLQAVGWSTRLEPVGPHNPSRENNSNTPTTATAAVPPPPPPRPPPQLVDGSGVCGSAESIMRMIVHVDAAGISHWPCCGCGQAAAFYSIVTAGQPGTFKLSVTRSLSNPGDGWSGAMTINSRQTIILAPTDGTFGLPNWGAVPVSFDVLGELQIARIRVMGTIMVQAGSNLQLADCMLHGSLLPNGTLAQMSIVRTEFGSVDFSVAGIVSIASSNLTQAKISFGKIRHVQVSHSVLSQWAVWRHELDQATSLAIGRPVCNDEIGASSCATRIGAGRSCANDFCPHLADGCYCTSMRAKSTWHIP